jgi:hypothetical protein
MSSKSSWLQRFWSRRVAASAYGGFAVTFIVLAIPPAWLADDRMRIIFLLLGFGCVAGFIYEWWFRKEQLPAPQQEPDVIPIIQAIDPRVRQAHREADGRIRLGLGPPATTLTMRRVLLAYFRNEAPTLKDRTRRASKLTAHVTLDNVNMSACGFWLDTYGRTIDLEVGDEAAVAVAFVVEREHAELVNVGPPEEVGITFWTCPSGDNCRAEERTAFVRLLEGGRLVAQAEYLIRLSSSAPDFQLVRQTVPQTVAHDVVRDAINPPPRSAGTIGQEAPSVDARPKISVRWIATNDANGQVLIKLYNNGASAAFNVEAVIWVAEALYAIRVEPAINRIGPHDEWTVVPVLDNGPRQPLKSQAQTKTFFRLALNWDSPLVQLGRKELQKVKRLMSFDPPPPDFWTIFYVNYRDFDGNDYSTPHVLTYFDEKGDVNIRLATTEDLATDSEADQGESAF